MHTLPSHCGICSDTGSTFTPAEPDHSHEPDHRGQIAAFTYCRRMHPVLELERSLWEPLNRNDADYVDRLLHPDYLEVGSSGRTWTREEIIEPVGDFHAELSGLAAAELAPDVVLVTYTSVIYDLAGTDEITQRPVKRTSLWMHRGGRWRLRYHQGTPDLG
jgi:ribonuclease HI